MLLSRSTAITVFFPPSSSSKMSLEVFSRAVFSRKAFYKLIVWDHEKCLLLPLLFLNLFSSDSFSLETTLDSISKIGSCNSNYFIRLAVFVTGKSLNFSESSWSFPLSLEYTITSLYPSRSSNFLNFDFLCCSAYFFRSTLSDFLSTNLCIFLFGSSVCSHYDYSAFYKHSLLTPSFHFLRLETQD